MHVAQFPITTSKRPYPNKSPFPTIIKRMLQIQIIILHGDGIYWWNHLTTIPNLTSKTQSPPMQSHYFCKLLW